MLRPLFFLPPLLALGACAGGPTTGGPAFIPTPGQATNSLIGMDARGLKRRFGAPRLDIRDPAADKLQFANERCILDTYLYPARDNREPVVTYAEARAPDGRPVDAEACAQILKK